MKTAESGVTAKSLRRMPVVALEQWLLRAMDSLAAKLGRAPRLPEHLETGIRGEEEAYFHLRRLGYVIIARQWKSVKRRGDLDLVGWSDDHLCFIEVKARTRRDWAPAESSVDDDKKRMLRVMARAFLRRCDDVEKIQTRFDVVSVYLLGEKAEFEVTKGAFAWA